MFVNYRVLLPLSLAIFVLGLVLGNINPVAAQSSDRVFELRTYTAAPGRLDALHARFAEYTIQLFERHGMTNIGYFSPQDGPLSESTLIYLLAHDSREAAEASWAAFRADPEWQSVAEETQRDGRIVEKVESVFLDPTSYSRMR
ncbi:MAG TPA: NIPSNAP family protein [Gammaproteobacteria bacterium]|jgi:hypothetical protein